MKQEYKGRVLIVDDDPDIRENLCDRLAAQGYEVLSAANGREGLEQIRRELPEVVLADVQMPGMGGQALLEALRDEELETSVVVISAHGNVERAVAAMRAGAVDFVEKPFELAHLDAVVSRAAARERQRRDSACWLSERERQMPDFIGSSPPMQAVLDLAQRAADSNSTVLLLGESGTGKEVLAQHIHAWSVSHARPFVAVNCVALASALLETELFGHEKGAFTGAHQRREGRFELAHGGTIFLDEIGSTSKDLQLKLLRVLQEGCLERVGGTQTIHCDVRVIAATNKNLQQLIAAGEFIEDLYYRLNVITIELPPLRQRREDIVALAAFFVEKCGREIKRQVSGIDPEALDCLLGYDWPGNVRELENAIERAVVLGDGGPIMRDDLPAPIDTDGPAKEDTGLRDYRTAVDAFRRQFVQQVLDETMGNQSQAAELMGLQRAYLSRLIKRLGMR